MTEETKEDIKLDNGHYDHLAGMHPVWGHLMLFIGVLSFSLTVLITLFSAL